MLPESCRSLTLEGHQLLAARERLGPLWGLFGDSETVENADRPVDVLGRLEFEKRRQGGAPVRRPVEDVRDDVHPGHEVELLEDHRAFGLPPALLRTAQRRHATPLGLPSLAETPIASVICDDRDRMRVRLEQNYGATRQGRGVRGPDAVVEIWAIPGTGDWTLVQTYADGQSCIIAMGQDWETLAPVHDPA